VFALDLPGFGQSARPASPWGSFEYAGLVAAFMKALHCQPAHIVGHSFGGKVAVCLAAHYPELVGKLILIDSAGIPPRRTLGYHLRVRSVKVARCLLSLVPTPRLREATLTRLSGLLGSQDYRESGAMRGTLVRVVNEDIRPLLPFVKACSLLIWGENDRDVPVRDGEIMAGHMPHARLEILTGAGHFPYLDRLPRFSQLVRDFLKES
jgi:pimeloyl-ACP methyl ester carboxylesterase